jgi:DNA polymerase III subunit epsilon
MRVLFFDTETTGLPLWKEPSDHPDQPHVIDISCELWDDETETMLDGLNAIVNIGVPIPADMTAIHGITDEMAANGQAPADVLADFLDLVKQADVIVGHNVSFDIRMMRIMAARVTGEKWEPMQPTFCTMRKSTNLVKAVKPSAKRPDDYKWPNLTETVRHFFDEEHASAHRAAPDCAAARRVYFELMKIAA